MTEQKSLTRRRFLTVLGGIFGFFVAAPPTAKERRRKPHKMRILPAHDRAHPAGLVPA